MATNQSSTKRSGGSAKRAPAKRAAAKRTPAKRSSSSNGRARSTRSTASTPASRNGNSGVTDTVKRTASKAAGPAIAVGAAAAGVAGGILLKSRRRRKTVLGVSLPRSLGKGLSDIDPKSVAKTVGQASKRFARTTKNVSKDLERAGDQAERIGKILD